jgi:ElaB/YqjD/DUF883 family membrane-anchored ribosome-binding protein
MARGAIAELMDLVRDARGTAESAGSHAADRVGRSGHRAKGELSKIWSQIEDLFDRNVTPTARGAARHAARSAEPYLRDGRDYAAATASQLRNVTRSHPLLAIGVAIAGTLVVTSLLSSAASRRSRD